MTAKLCFKSSSSQARGPASGGRGVCPGGEFYSAGCGLFLTLWGPAPGISWLSAWQDYFTQLESNTFLHLAAVLGLVFLFFLYRLYSQQRAIRAARNEIPLVIGGWGTRGKSGTERCKAALFHAYGAEVFSKTTGCEAMFIHSPPNQAAEELFLFRPYDKVSIWEQKTVLSTAAQLGCQVFLYECMALNPRYVGVIQHGWMRDDFSTLTNAYPDHEDIQGPAGFNVATVIGNFMPRHTICWTAETQMLPLLREAARKRGSELRAATWLDAAMFTDDLLDRLPYREHPANLAIVLQMARHLGIDPDFAIKEIADHLVPDLGVLRTYPEARYRGRGAYFSNGMSANERLGSLSNWKRLGFYEQTARTHPGEWIIGVINNRADRIPRSKVFAGMVARDIAAHRFFLIGSNLKGMVGYIDEELRNSRQQWNFLEDRDLEGVKRRLAKELERWKVCICERSDLERATRLMLEAGGLDSETVGGLLAGSEWASLVQAAEQVAGTGEERQGDALRQVWARAGEGFCKRLEEILPGADRLGRETHEGVGFEDLAGHLRQHWEELRRVRSLYQQLTQLCAGGAIPPEAHEAWQDFMIELVRGRVVVIWDFYASGDQIIQRILQEIPPGHRAHLCGLQNIKGTGLDFAYRWVDLLKVWQVAQGLKASTAQVRRESLLWLSNYTSYHYWEALLALEALKAALQEPAFQDLRDQELLKRAIEKVRTAARACEKKMSGGGQQGAWYFPLLDLLESFLDIPDGIRRRMKYDRILEDLVHQRISHRRAGEELRSITYRQKGGWLKKAFSRE